MANLVAHGLHQRTLGRLIEAHKSGNTAHRKPETTRAAPPNLASLAECALTGPGVGRRTARPATITAGSISGARAPPRKPMGSCRSPDPRSRFCEPPESCRWVATRRRTEPGYLEDTFPSPG